MSCDYPDCVGGQNGTTCKEECKQAWKECHGPCQQGRLPCPTPDACERSAEEKPHIPSLPLAIMLVLVIFIVLWVLS